MRYRWSCLTIILLAGCASSGTGHVLQLTPSPLATGCGAADRPNQLPSVIQLFDDAPNLAAFDSAGATDSGAVLLSLTFGKDGEIAGLRTLESTLPAARASAAIAVLRRQARPVPDLANTSIRLLVRRGDSLSLVLGYSEYCPPRPLQRAPPQTVTTKVRVDQPGNAVEVRQPEFRALVDERGRVAQVQLVMSSGYSDLDQRLMAGIQGGTYRAATVDGQPRAVWISLPPR
jgi:hypothetical protein